LRPDEPLSRRYKTDRIDGIDEIDRTDGIDEIDRTDGIDGTDGIDEIDGTDQSPPLPNCFGSGAIGRIGMERTRALRHLFSPISIGGMEVKNRIVMPPMRTGFGTGDGSVTPRHLHYYAARAKGGAGLIIVEVTTVHPKRKYTPNSLGLFQDSLIPGWRELAEVVHAHGARIATELLDPGPFGPSSLSGMEPVGPSPLAARNIGEVPRELDPAEIQAIIRDFVAAAGRAREAGLDAVEIHACHAFALVGSFLSPLLNKRSDIYGGSLEGRGRLLLEIVQGIKAEVGRDFPVIVRLSGDERVPGGQGIQETQLLASMLAEVGADALEISGGTIPGAFWAVVAPSGTPLAINARLAEAVKEAVRVPVICVGRINDPLLADFLIRTGKADMVSMGRALIADPELPNKAASGRLDDIAPCVADNYGCLGTPLVAKDMGCIVNPAVGREEEFRIVLAARAKRVLVAGGGPAGLEAATVAALRGHRVTLIEKGPRLGGQLNLASVPPFMQELSRLTRYLIFQATKAGVEVELGRTVTVDTVREMGPEVVVVATGATPLIPEIPGIDQGRVATAWDVLAGRAGLRARNVVVLGGGSVGCETADFLAETGDNPFVGRTSVTVVEKTDEVAMDMAGQARSLLMERLREKGVRILVGTKVGEIRGESVVVERDGCREFLGGLDLIVLALGAAPVDELSERIRGLVPEVYLIGDARRPRRILDAISEGAEAGMRI